MIRLEFGPPTDMYQALYRLPTRKHSLYEHDIVIEHSVHFGKTLKDLLILNHLYPEMFDILPVDKRLIPLTSDDVLSIARTSFKRAEVEPIMTVNWGYVGQNNMWSNIFPIGDDEYRWWQVTDMVSSVIAGNTKLVCIETNDEFSLTANKAPRCNENSEFEVGLLKVEEIASLQSALARFKT